jgi:hypothetical protein
LLLSSREVGANARSNIEVRRFAGVLVMRLAGVNLRNPGVKFFRIQKSPAKQLGYKAEISCVASRKLGYGKIVLFEAVGRGAAGVRGGEGHGADVPALRKDCIGWLVWIDKKPCVS